MVIVSSESCAFKRQNAKLVFVVSNGHLSFQGHKIEVSGGESQRKGEWMRGHSPFVQERKGDGMGHKPTPCCGSWMREVKEDTKKSLILYFTSAPADDSKNGFFT